MAATLNEFIEVKTPGQFNPNGLSVPVFRAEHDLEFVAVIYMSSLNPLRTV
jgi:hypothetical protein